MDTVGAYLKSERERLNKSLREIADVTRIGKSTLAAIEEGKTAFMPPQSYVKGFLRLYAKELELDPDEIVQRYDMELIDTKWGAQRELKEADAERKKKRRTLRIGIGVLLLLVLLFAVFLWQSRLEPVPRDADRLDEAAVVDTPPHEPDEEIPELQERVPEPAEVTVPEEAPPAAAIPEEFTVGFAARDLTWIKIMSDDEPPFEIMLRADESYERTARTRMEVRIGNAGGVDLFFNDGQVEIAEGTGRPVDLVFPEAAGDLRNGN